MLRQGTEGIQLLAHGGRQPGQPLRKKGTPEHEQHSSDQHGGADAARYGPLRLHRFAAQVGRALKTDEAEHRHHQAGAHLVRRVSERVDRPQIRPSPTLMHDHHGAGGELDVAARQLQAAQPTEEVGQQPWGLPAEVQQQLLQEGAEEHQAADQRGAIAQRHPPPAPQPPGPGRS